jgi:hypothetical protein
MKLILIALAASLIILSLTGCSLFQYRQPTPLPTPEAIPSPTSLVPLPSTSVPTPTFNAPENSQSSLSFAPTPTLGGIVPGSPSGPYAVIQVVAGDALNLRSGPGINYPALGSFPPSTNNIMRTGPSASVEGYLWVEVQNPTGGNGWVNSYYLTEYVHPSNFCADARASSLIMSFADALKASNGKSLAALVSPAGGWSVQLWRGGNIVVFDRAHAQWVFVSTYEHNWGAAPQSGQDTVGAIHVVVLPKLLDVFTAPAPGYTLSCNVIQAGGANYSTSWPEPYANINYYSVYKPGPAGNELSWRTLLIGIEYVQGQPYIFSTSQLQWEP